jgi:hypothetical protein
MKTSPVVSTMIGDGEQFPPQWKVGSVNDPQFTLEFWA